MLRNLCRLWDQGRHENMLFAWTMASGIDLPAFQCLLVTRRMEAVFTSKDEDEGHVYFCFGHICAVGWIDGYEIGGVIPADTDMMGFVQFLDDISWVDSKVEGEPCIDSVVALWEGREYELGWVEYRAHPGSDSYHGYGAGYVDENGYPFDDIPKWRPI